MNIKSRFLKKKFTKNYYIFFYASTCSLGELDKIMNKTKFQRLKILS